MAYPFTDLALSFSEVSRRCDIVIADGDLVLSATPAAALLLSIGCDRRAERDDDLPDASEAFSGGTALPARRGAAGDALDAAGRRCGSRLWLLAREKASEAVRSRAEDYTAEALAWLTDELGETPEIDVAWTRPSVLGIGVRVGDFSLSVVRRVGAG